jgi:hypothetical protein
MGAAAAALGAGAAVGVPHMVQNLAFGAISASQLVHRTTVISSFQIENGEWRMEN